MDYIALIFIFKLLLLFKRFICRRFVQFRSEFTRQFLTDYFVSSESGGKVLYHEQVCNKRNVYCNNKEMILIATVNLLLH